MASKRDKKAPTIRSVEDFDRIIGSERLDAKPRYGFDDPTLLGREIGNTIVERVRESRGIVADTDLARRSVATTPTETKHTSQTRY